MAKVNPIKVDSWLRDLVGSVRVTVDSGFDRLRVSCAPEKASLLMAA